MGRAAELSPWDPHVGQGKSCLPTGARQGRGENQWGFLNFSKFSTGAAILRAVPVDTAGGFAPDVAPFRPFYLKLAQIPLQGSLLPLHSSLCVSREG